MALECWCTSIVKNATFLGLAGISSSGFSFCKNPPRTWPVHMVTL